MALQAIFKFRNLDATVDFNKRFELLFSKGIYTGSAVTPVTGTLQVNLSPFRAINSEGLIVIETANTTLTIPAGQTSIVLTRAKYLPNTDPILATEVLEESIFNADPDLANLIIHAKIVLGSGATQVTSADIDESVKETIDPVKRFSFRGVVASSGNLPATNNKTGDAFVSTNGSGDTPELFVFNGVSFINITSAGIVLTALNDHRQNLNVDEKHLTDMQAGAVGGTFGAPDVANRFVTETDPRLPTQDENDALIGSDGTPNAANKFVTLARPAVEGSIKTFTSTPTNLVITLAEGPVYVGKGPANSADKFFRFIDNATQAIYKLAGSIKYVSVNGVFKDAALTQLLDPSTDVEVDANGFFIGANIYLRASDTPDTGVSIVYGKQKTFGSIDPGVNVFVGPQDYPFQTEILQAIANIKEDAADAFLPVGQSLPKLASKIDDQRRFLASAFVTDVVVSPFDYKRLLKSSDSAVFSPVNIGIPDVVLFSNVALTAFTYTPSSGLVQYAGVVDLTNVKVNHLLKDGAGNTFTLTAVDNLLNTVTLGLNLVVDNTVANGVDGSIIADNNPLKIVLSDMRVVYGIERFNFSRSRVKPGAFINNQTVHEVFHTESSLPDPRLALVGEWNQNVTSSNDVTIIVVFYGTGLNLLTDIQNQPSSITVKLDNAASPAIDPTQAGLLANPGNDGIRTLPILKNLTKTIHTVELSFDTGAVPFKFNGFEVLTESNTLTDLTGRAFVNTSLIKSDTLLVTSLPTNQKGGSLIRYIDNVTLVKSFANNAANTFVTTANTDGTNILKTVNDLTGFAVGQTIRVSTNVGDVHFDIITAINTSANTITVQNIPSFVAVVTVEFILWAGIQSTHANEKLSFRTNYRELINPTSTPSDLAGVAPDNSTILVGEQVTETSANISGVPRALAGNTVRFTFVGTGLDLLVANTLASSPVAIMDGIRTQTLTITPTGLQRVMVFSDAPYGSHTVEIALNGALISEFIVYETQPSPFSGLPLAESHILSDYVSGADADNNAISFGTIYKATNTDLVFKSGTTGTTDWTVEASVLNAPRTGTLKKSNKQDAEIQINFYGTGFEFEYLASPLNAISEFVLDGSVLTSTNFGSSTLAGNNFDPGTGKLDMFLGSNSSNRKVRVSGLNLDYHTLTVRNTGAANVSATDTFINVEGIGVIVPLWINVVQKNRLLLGNNNLHDLRNFTSFDDDNVSELGVIAGVGVASGVYEEVDETTANGSLNLFTLPLAKTYEVGSKTLQVWKNGVKMFLLDDYNEVTDPDGLGRTIQFIVPPAFGAKIGYRI